MHAVTWVVLGAAAATLIFGGLQQYEDLFGGLAIVAAVILVLSGIVLGLAGFESRACVQKAADLDRDYRFGLVAGCRVETTGGTYVSLDNLRITDEEESP